MTTTVAVTAAYWINTEPGRALARGGAPRLEEAVEKEAAARKGGGGGRARGASRGRIAARVSWPRHTTTSTTTTTHPAARPSIRAEDHRWMDGFG